MRKFEATPQGREQVKLLEALVRTYADGDSVYCHGGSGRGGEVSIYIDEPAFLEVISAEKRGMPLPPK